MKANNNKKAKGRFWYLLSPSAGATTIPPICSSSDVLPRLDTRPPDHVHTSSSARTTASIFRCHILAQFLVSFYMLSQAFGRGAL
jgi:hypothetical protein